MASALLLVAHRGYPARYPENSLEGLEAALRAGACWVEFDVQISADGVPVLLHDATLERTAGREGCVMEMTCAALDTISVHEPQRFGNNFDTIRLPTLAQALALLQGWPRARAFVEIKEESLSRFGTAAVLTAVVDIMRRHEASCVLISYAADALAPARAAGFEIGWVLRDWNDDVRRQAESLGPDYLICNHRRLPAAAMELWPGPWRWVSYEVSDPAQALALAERGIGMVETDDIGVMLEHPLLRERSCRDG